MPNLTAKRATEIGDLEQLRREIREMLARVKTQIDRDIRSYPTPIPRCDAQFNYLHEQQGRLARELDHIGSAEGVPLRREDCLERIERFLASAPHGDEPAERELRARVKSRLLELAERGRS